MLTLALACVTPEPVDSGEAPTGCEGGSPELELAQPDTDYGLEDGAEVWSGIPPQGGAPYSPFRIRVRGVSGLETEAVVSISIEDTLDGADLASVVQTHGFLCSNTGTSNGWWVASEVHSRFTGFELEAIAGRTALVTASVTGASGVATSAYTGLIVVDTR